MTWPRRGALAATRAEGGEEPASRGPWREWGPADASISAQGYWTSGLQGRGRCVSVVSDAKVVEFVTYQV